MSITNANSLLLLGAGVSAPFGMPLGGELIDAIAVQLKRELARTKRKNNFGSEELYPPDYFERWLNDAETWRKNPIFASVLFHFAENNERIHASAIASAHTALSRLHDLLRNQTAETIDAFIAENETIAPFAKLALASVMLEKTYGLQDGRLVLRPLNARYLPALKPDQPSERNWIHLLINIVRHGIDRGDVTQQHKIKIITFNYDCILEHVLSTQFNNRERDLQDYSKYFEIVHVHGKFDAMPAQCLHPARLACEWAKQICVVNEREPSTQVLDDRTRAREMLIAAKQVYSIGFSFAGPNCRLIGLAAETSRPGSGLKYCNYDGDRGVKEAAARYAGAYSQIEIAGDWQRPLSASAFIKGGHLGEPPG